MSDERHSHTEQVELVTDPIELAKREVENGIRQFDLMSELIRANVKKNDKARFRLRIRDILRLQEAALKSIHPSAGAFRNTPVKITGSKHAPPDQFSIPEEVADLCQYVNDNWDMSSPVHLAAYVLWKLNWIHPFADGNGRTARAISYAVISIKLDGMLPGTPTIPEQIAVNKGPYYDALEKADDALERGRIDVSELEKMLSNMLAKQLLSIAVLSEASADRIDKLLEFRVKRAPSDILRDIYGTDDLEGRLWRISLDQVAYQVAAAAEIQAAENRLSEEQSPFPNLLATSDEETASRIISTDDDGTLIVNARFESVQGGAALRLQEGVSIGLVHPFVNSQGSTKWGMQGTLYLFRFGKSISPTALYDSIDLMIAKHISLGSAR